MTPDAFIRIGERPIANSLPGDLRVVVVVGVGGGGSVMYLHKLLTFLVLLLVIALTQWKWTRPPAIINGCTAREV